ncbi:MAG: repressor LexA [Clostridiales bacterium]|nr:repressor LexA [Clostridiales bacterium]
MTQSKRRPRGDTQRMILEYIRETTAERGYPPSVREIGESVGLTSTATVHVHLKNLEEKGLIRRDSMKPRAIDIRGKSGDIPAMAASNVPVIGRVAAGTPILAEQYTEAFLSFPEKMVASGDEFVLAVRGDSMIDADIHNGDYVLVHQQNIAENGEIVAAMIDGEATIKRFFKEKGMIRLQPENKALSPIYSRDVVILGKVIAVYHEVK